MTLRLASLGIALLVTLFAIPASAEHRNACPTYTDETTVGVITLHGNARGQVLIDATEATSGTHQFYLSSDAPYADHDPLSDPVFSIWLYEETNGEPGLQRNDDACHDSGDGEGDAFLGS